MSASHLEPLLRNAERHAVARVLRSNPDWTLGDVVAYIDNGGARSAALRSLPLCELMLHPAHEIERADDGPPIDPSVLGRAKWATGVEFDQLLCDVLEAAGRSVRASYLRARVGGPRWKLQAALRRMVNAKIIERSGVTSATRYHLAGGSEGQR